MTDQYWYEKLYITNAARIRYNYNRVNLSCHGVTNIRDDRWYYSRKDQAAQMFPYRKQYKPLVRDFGVMITKLYKTV